VLPCPAGDAGGGATFREILRGPPVAEAVAALYAYESQVPEIATTKIDGLKKFYGVTQPRAGVISRCTRKRTRRIGGVARWLEEHVDGKRKRFWRRPMRRSMRCWGGLDAVHCESRKQGVKRQELKESKEGIYTEDTESTEVTGRRFGRGLDWIGVLFCGRQRRRAGQGPPLTMKC